VCAFAQVLLDIIASAKIDIFLVSFVADDVRSVVAAMNAAASRGVRVRVLLETSTSYGGALSIHPAATMRSSVPTAELFTWRERPEPFVDGKVHAKLAVADGLRAELENEADVIAAVKSTRPFTRVRQVMALIQDATRARHVEPPERSSSVDFPLPDAPSTRPGRHRPARDRSRAGRGLGLPPFGSSSRAPRHAAPSP
jgi:hypothetical protein